MEKPMIVLSIDSTSFLPRVALTKDEQLIKEVSETKELINWSKFLTSDGTYLHEEFIYQLDILFDGSTISIEDVDVICYSGFSGYKKSMIVGKVFAETLGYTYKKKVVCIDHITSHYFSSLVGIKSKEWKCPILYFSASGAHDSFALMRNPSELNILYNSDIFDAEDKRYIGLGLVFDRLVRGLGLMKKGDTPKDISRIISELDYEISDELFDFIYANYEETSVYDINFFPVYDLFKRKYINDLKYPKNVLYFTFQEAINEIISKKIIKISKFTQCKEIHVVGGIANNDYFIDTLEDAFKKSSIKIVRPQKSYRFDNASMLGIFCYHDLQKGSDYSISKLVSY